MKRKLFSRALYPLLLCAGLFLSLAITASASGVVFPFNQSGQSYGSSMDSDGDTIVHPDLIAAIGIGHIEGYVLKTDLEGTGPLARPQTPEEAIIYMELLDELIADAKARGDEYLYYIPLYEPDGKTVIGEFGISIPTSMAPAFPADDETDADK